MLLGKVLGCDIQKVCILRKFWDAVSKKFVIFADVLKNRQYEESDKKSIP